MYTSKKQVNRKSKTKPLICSKYLRQDTSKFRNLKNNKDKMSCPFYFKV